MARSFHQNLAHIIFSTENRQEGYGWFSVSRSNIDRVIGYIEGQKEHHRKVPFKEEFITYLKRHEIEYDERFVWD